MAGHRKSHKATSSPSRGSHKSPQHRYQFLSKKKIDDQLYQSLEEEVISTSRNSAVTWKEFMFFCLLMLAMAAASVFLGVAAGMTISIHYYEEKGTLASQQRITTLDQDIHNIVLQTARVADPFGIDEVLQEAPPLHPHEIDSSTTNQTQAIALTEATIPPTLCSDGITVGYDDWNSLNAAVREANSLSAERFIRWNEYFAKQEGNVRFDNASLYYEEDVIFTICPGVTLKARRGPIFINAENIVIQCDGCTIDVGGSHLAFGPHAKNALVRGVTFKGAKASSLTFYYDGSEASFEDCYWYGNAGIGKSGAVADVNSTSSVAFYRCGIDDANNAATISPRGTPQGLASSLSIRR